MAAPRRDLPEDLVRRPRLTRDLLAAGVSEHELRGPLWQQLVRGVHVFRPTALGDPWARIHGVAAAMPVGAAIGGWAALYLLGVRDLDGRTGPAAARRLPVLVCLGPSGRMRRQPGVDIDRSLLPRGDLTTVGGVRVTSAARACVDIMCRDGVEAGMVAGDAALRAGVVQLGEILKLVGRRRRVRGVPAARTAAGLLDGRAASTTESRLRFVWVVVAGFPRPEVNVRIVDRSGFTLGVADLFDAGAGLVGEYDGRDHRSLERLTSDNAREEGLERHGLVVVRATALDLWPRRAHLVVRLRAAHRDGLDRDRVRDRWRVARPPAA